MNIFIVVTNGDGNVIDSKSISSEEITEFKALYAAVTRERESLEKKYPEPKYTIHVGVGDSLVSVLRSFPEIRSPKIVA